MAKPQINLPPSEIWGDLGLGRGSRLYNFHAYNYLQRELPTTSTFTERLAQPRARFPGVNVIIPDFFVWEHVRVWERD